MKKVLDRVYITSNEGLVHFCPKGKDWSFRMLLRDTEEGPMYWCGNCGYTIEEGEAMAIRLNEVTL